MSPTAPCFAVVLAAGRSRRFGSDKLITPIDGRPMLLHVLDAVAECERSGHIRTTYVVLSGDSAASGLVGSRRGAIAVTAERADEGLGASLQAGVARAQRSAPVGPASILVVLGDQPGARPEVMRDLIRRWRASGSLVVRPRYSASPEVPGHPVLVDRALWPRMADLGGDSGLQTLLHDIAIEQVDVEGQNPDIDTRTDLKAWSGKDVS